MLLKKHSQVINVIFIAVIFIIVVLLLSSLYFKTEKTEKTEREEFANQYSLLTRDAPTWGHFGLTEKPRVSNRSNPITFWWQNNYWDKYDAKLDAHLNSDRYADVPGFRPPCKLNLDSTYGYESRCKCNKAVNYEKCQCDELRYSNLTDYCKIHPEYRRCPEYFRDDIML